MVKRRSLDSALTPEQQAFLEPQAKAKPRPKAQPKPTPQPKEEPPMQTLTMKEETISELIASSAKAQANPEPYGGVVSLTVRVKPEISTALLRASMERKIQRVAPYTQREIAEAALELWLKTNGFLS